MPGAARGKVLGTRDIEIQWKSFRLDIAKPRTIGTLIKMAREAGADVDGLMQGCERFEDCDICGRGRRGKRGLC